jgi:DNA polymerase-3 subunit gamma/tau
MLQTPSTFAALVDLLANRGKPHLAQMLHDFVGIVRYEPPTLVFRPTKALASDFNRDLAAALKGLTGTSWTVEASDADGEPTLLEQEKMAADAVRQEVLGTPMVRAAFEAFPDAELADYTFNEQRSG